MIENRSNKEFTLVTNKNVQFNIDDVKNIILIPEKFLPLVSIFMYFPMLLVIIFYIGVAATFR